MLIGAFFVFDLGQYLNLESAKAHRESIEATYRDRVAGALAAATGGAFPCVVAQIPTGYVCLLDPPALARCAGSVEQLAEALHAAAAREGLRRL